MTEEKAGGEDPEDPREIKDDANDAGGTMDREGLPKGRAKNATDVPDGARAQQTTGDSDGKSSDKAHDDKVPLFDTPGFQKVVAAMLGLITVAISSAMFVLVLSLGGDGGDGGDGGNVGGAGGGDRWHTAFFTVFIGLFGVLITGLFVFMAFRIDRGARWEAQQVAEREVKRAAKAARGTARKRAGKVAATRARKVAAAKAREVAVKEAREVAAEEAREVAVEEARKTASAESQRKFEEMLESFRKASK